MHKLIDEIKKNESKPFVVSNFLDQNDLSLFQKLYAELPLEIDNKKQKIKKKNGPIIFIQIYKKNIVKN